MPRGERVHGGINVLAGAGPHEQAVVGGIDALDRETGGERHLADGGVGWGNARKRQADKPGRSHNIINVC